MATQSQSVHRHLATTFAKELSRTIFSEGRAFLLLILLLTAFATPLLAQQSAHDACIAKCRSSDDSPCIGQTGANFTQCVKNCVSGCPPAPPPPPPPPLLDPGCGSRSIQGKINCTIDQPNVKQHETEYSTVLFAPGDVVEVTADGCVQTGGLGATWKRYVNPSGPNSATLYHGLIRIPTGTPNSALVEIRTVIGKQLMVTGTGVSLSQLDLHLGYEDDDYSDNGYYAHDDGTEDQCKGTSTQDGGPAHVTVTIYRGVAPGAPTSRFDFDVVSSSLDPNGLPHNPLWTWQTLPENQGKIPNTSMCHNFSTRESTLGIPNEFMSPYFSDCTDQTDLSEVDLPIDINATICNYGTIPYFGDTFAGHVNWFPITIEGSGGWGDHGADDDYTFTYTADGQANPLSVNGRSGLHVEFDSDETIDHFSAQEWNDFHNAVDNNKTQAELLFDGHTDKGGYAILTGMFGLDGEHGMKAELHPLFALAIRRDTFENSQNDEAWLMFVRNQGDEGFCSSSEWDLGLEDYTVRLPWRAGMQAVNVDWGKTNFVGTDGTSGPTVTAIAPPSLAAGVYVSFHLGPAVLNSDVFGTPASVPFLDGVLHLSWSGQLVTHPLVESQQTAVSRLPTTGVVMSHPVTVAGANNEPEVGVDGSEQLLSTAINAVPDAQREQVKQARVLPGVKPAIVHPLPPTGPVKMMTEMPAVARLAKLHAIKGGPAQQKLARDAAQMKALCAASNNAPSGLPPSVCKPTIVPATQ